MPTYTIRTDSGDGPDGSKEPMEFPHRQAACDDAQVALTEMAKERIPIERSAHFAVEIDDDAGQRVYKATLHIDGKLEPTVPDCPDVASQLDKGPGE